MAGKGLLRFELTLLASAAYLTALIPGANAAPLGSLQLYAHPPTDTTQINALSGNGLTAVGYVNAAAGTYARSWTADGVATDLGFGVDTSAWDISGDGSTIVGDDQSGPTSFGWVQKGGGTLQLPTLGMTDWAQAKATNTDGTVVVGSSDTGALVAHATMWSGPNWSVMQDLGSFIPIGMSMATDISGNGDIVVG